MFFQVDDSSRCVAEYCETHFIFRKFLVHKQLYYSVLDSELNRIVSDVNEFRWQFVKKYVKSISRYQFFDNFIHHLHYRCVPMWLHRPWSILNGPTAAASRRGEKIDTGTSGATNWQFVERSSSLVLLRVPDLSPRPHPVRFSPFAIMGFPICDAKPPSSSSRPTSISKF